MRSPCSPAARALPRLLLLVLATLSLPTLAAATEPPAAAEPAVLRAERIEPDGRFRFVADWRAPAAPRTAFALGGGGAWGAAHIGLLKAAYADGLAPDMVAGTSIGAAIGALLASGMPLDEIERAYRTTDWAAILARPSRPLTLSVPHDPLAPHAALWASGRQREGGARRWRGLVPDHALQLELFRHLAYPGAACERDFDRLAIPFRAVTTDLASGTVYAPQNGWLPLIVRASMGLPIFTTVELDDRVLVDGGVLENVPALVAREMGAAAVVAVRLSSDGQELSPMRSPMSFGSLLERTYDVAFAAQRAEALASADVVVDIATGGAWIDDFDLVDELLAAGRAAWEWQRDDVLAALERHATDTRVFRVGAVRAARGGGMGAGVSPAAGTGAEAPAATEEPARVAAAADAAAAAAAGEIAERLGIADGPRTVSALRLQLELVRLLRGGGHSGGELRFEPPAQGRQDAGGVLLVVLEPAPRVRDVQFEVPPALDPEFRDLARVSFPANAGPARILASVQRRLTDAHRRGLVFAGIESARFDPAGEVLTVKLDAGELGSLTVRAPESDRSIPLPPGLASTGAGEPVQLQGLIDDLFRLSARGALSDILGIETTRRPDGRYDVAVSVADPPLWEAAGTIGYSSALGFVLRGRMAWPTQPGWHRWGLEGRAAVGREGGQLGLETNPPGTGGRQLFGRLVGGRTLVPRWSADGNYDGSTGFWSGAAAIGARTRPGRLGIAELSFVGRFADDDAFTDTGAEPGSDLAAEFAWRGDSRDDPGVTRRGMAWSLTATEPLAGDDRGRVFTADLALHVPWGRASPWSLAFLGMAATARGGPLPLDRWSDPGGLSEAPRLLPGRGLAPSCRRGTLLLRRELGQVARVFVTAGASAAAWRLGELRADPSVPRDGDGYALFVEAQSGRFGPFVIGVMHGSLDGDAFFFAMAPFRFPRPAPSLTLPR